MNAKTTVKCAYKHCKHESREISRDSAVKIGSSYYHSDCLIIRDLITEIKDTYRRDVDNIVSTPQLLGVINNLIFKKDIEPEFLLFGLNYWINKNVKIKSPYALHYLKDNKLIMKAWNNR